MFLSKIFKILLPADDKEFYSLFEEGAKVCHEAAKLYREIVNSGLTEDRLKEPARLKQCSNTIAKNTLLRLNKTFITPIDRENIQSLATMLNKITKKIIKSAKDLKVYRLSSSTDKMKSQAEILVSATEELQRIVPYLRNVSLVGEVTERNHKMKALENYGDDIFHESMDELFSGKYDPLTVIKLSDVYNSVEAALNNCFTVSDDILNIMLKHS